MYQLCELFLNNKTLNKLYLDISVPDHVIDKMSTALKANLDLILWENPNNDKLMKFIEANRIIQESIDKGIEIKIEDNEPIMKELLAHKLKSFGVRQNIQIDSTRDAGHMKTIKEVSADQYNSTSEDKKDEQQQKTAELPISPIIEENLLEQKYAPILQEKLDKKEFKIDDFVQNAFNTINKLESNFEQKIAELIKQKDKESAEKYTILENRMNMIEEQNKNLLKIIEKTDIVNKISPKKDNDFTEKYKKIETELEKYKNIAQNLESKLQNLEQFDNQFSLINETIENLNKEHTLKYAELSKQIISLQNSYDTFNKISSPLNKSELSESRPLKIQNIINDSSIPRTEIDAIKQKQTIFQHKLRELELSLDEFNKMHKLNHENLSLQIKNLELSKSLILLEKRPKFSGTKSSGPQIKTEVPNSINVSMNESYLSRKKDIISEISPIPSETDKTLDLPIKKSINVQSPPKEKQGRYDKPLLKLGTSPKTQISPIKSQKLLTETVQKSGPSKELLEFLKNKGLHLN